MERQRFIFLPLVAFIAAGVSLGLWVPPAFATRGGPCAGDVANFCKDVQPGQGRIAKCIKEHERELSPECATHMAEMKKTGQETRGACSDDALRFCNDVKPGEGNTIRCLKQHENELTAPCKARIQRLQ